MKTEDIKEVLNDFETINTTLEEREKKSSIAPSLNEFLQLLIIKRLGGIEGELYCILQNLEWLKNIDDKLDDLTELIGMDLGEQGAREFVKKMLDADDAEDRRKFLRLVKKVEDPT